MKKSRKTWLFLLIVVLALFAFPLVINIAFKYNSGIKFFQAEWSSGDALGFYGSVIGTIGTVFLGYVAWKQNERLTKIEENNFINENACPVVVKEMAFFGFKNTAVNFDRHEEQVIGGDVIIDNIESYLQYSSIELTIKIEPLSKVIPSFIHVKNIILCAAKEDKEYSQSLSCIFVENKDERFSKIAMSKNFCLFNCTVIIKDEDKKKIIDKLTSESSIVIISIDFDIASYNNTVSSLKCNAKLKPILEKKSIVSFEVKDDVPPTVFWTGAKQLSHNEIKVKKV
ncbi:MAG: hypothetical protein MJ147_02305 [Clostridia bacterium]|nr:hypothetical protein [Clostridia bacterium]